MRLGEAEQVVSLFRNHYHIPLVHADVSRCSWAALKARPIPEAKRKFIGKTFIDVFEAEAKKIGGADFLAQGTLYPDVIESVSFTGRAFGDDQEPPQRGRPARAHEHEARRALARAVQGRSALGRELGLPDIFVGRHPFPGPGLAIRIPGEVNRERADMRKADAIYLEEIRNAGLYDAIWQAFAVPPGQDGGRDGRLPHIRFWSAPCGTPRPTA
jgi:GMP synthase (glutamine-hydrolysing)